MTWRHSSPRRQSSLRTHPPGPRSGGGGGTSSPGVTSISVTSLASLVASVGLLSVIIAAMPMPPAPRGAIAAVLGLAGVIVPIAIGALPPWLVLVPMIGVLVLVPGLLIRHEYRDALLPRFLVTLGALAVLVPLLLPQHGAIPLVSVFKALIEAPGMKKIDPAFALALVTIVVMAFLAWLPAPATGAAKLWAWLLILWSLLVLVPTWIQLAIDGKIVDLATATPAALLTWLTGGGGGFGVAYLVLIGYGLAAVLGRQLE